MTIGNLQALNDATAAGFAAMGDAMSLKVDKSGGGIITGVAGANINTSGTNTLFIRPSINVSDGTLFYSSTPDFATPKPLEIIASTVLFGVNSKVNILPTPNSFAQGIVIGQSSPTSGVVAGPFYFNQINAVVRSALTTGGIPGNPNSGTWAGLQVSVNAGGANYDGDSVMGGSFGVTQTIADTSLGDKNGLSSGVSIAAATLGKAYGGSSGATVSGTGSAAALVGYETDVILESVSVPHVIGFNAWAGGSKQGSLTHAAYAIGASGGSGPYGAGVAGWKTGFRLFTQGGATNPPMATTGNLFDSDHNATLADIFSFGNVTVTGNILAFPNVTLSGAGALSTAGNITINKANANLALTGTGDRAVSFLTNAVARFGFGVTGAESTGNAGSNIFLNRYSDAGALLGTPLTISRATGAIAAEATIKTGVYTVATLPAAGTVGAGARAFVTDANSTTFLATATGGGANAVPVVSDGANWKIG